MQINNSQLTNNQVNFLEMSAGLSRYATASNDKQIHHTYILVRCISAIYNRHTVNEQTAISDFSRYRLVERNHKRT